jgi:hypothetical protein
MLLGLCIVFEVVLVASGIAEILLHGYTPAAATMLKLSSNYVLTAVVKENKKFW